MERLSDRERERYSRQIMLEQLGEEGQLKLKEATVGVLGVGGLGSPVSQYLVAAGVGSIILVDDQTPDLSNLNRQILHWEEDCELGTSKVESAAAKLRRLNSEVRIQTLGIRVDESNIQEAFSSADLVVDCLDDFHSRLFLNDFCVKEKKPFVHGAVEAFHGQVTTIVPGVSPCLRCIFPRAPPRKEKFPVLGATAGVFGSIQAAEAIKLIVGMGESLTSRLLVGDLLYQEWEIIDLCRVESCNVCGHL